MATPQPPLTPEQRLALENQKSFEKFRRTVAIGGVIVCPAIALLPPRKLDLYTFALGVGTYLSADYLSTSYTGRGIVHHVTPKWMYGSSSTEKPGVFSALPTEKALETQQRIEQERRRKEMQEAIREGREPPAEKKPKGLLQRLWMGDEEEGWKERRLEAERKALAEGKGYTGMILDQVWEVWNWDKKKGSEESEKKDGPKS